MARDGDAAVDRQPESLMLGAAILPAVLPGDFNHGFMTSPATFPVAGSPDSP